MKPKYLFPIIASISLSCDNALLTPSMTSGPAPVQPPKSVKPDTSRRFAEIESEILTKINELRATSGYCKARLRSTGEIVLALDVHGPTHVVKPDSLLTEAAALYADDLAKHGLGTPHIGSDGSDVFDRVKSLEKPHKYYGVTFPSRWESVGENATIFYEPNLNKVAEKAVNNWRESPDGHCQAQWSPKFFFAGVAVAKGTQPGSYGHWIAVTVYARPVGGGPGF